MGRPRKRKRRDKLEAALSALTEATSDRGSPTARDALLTALREADALVVARAASIVQDSLLDGFGDALVSALDRFLEGGGVGADPGCHAKLAIVEALDATDEVAPEAFGRASRHVQMEPAFGPPVDTAAALRARALLALGRSGEPDVPVFAGRALADREPVVRRAAMIAIATHRDRSAAGLAWLKVTSGDEDPLVTAEAMNALVALAPDLGVPALAELLEGADAERRELAAMALGESRRPEALPILLEALPDVVLGSERAPFYTALALHRSEPALRTLLDLVATPDGTRVLGALGVRRYEPEVCERAEAAARAAGLDAAFRAAFLRD
ncbi:MAG: HEAT repeat domain-containing protein [Sandaracinaceae bacterium]